MPNRSHEAQELDSPVLDVVHTFAPAPFGGLERVVQALAVEQARAGRGVHVVAVLDGDAAEQPYLRAMEAAGVRVHVRRPAARAYRREREMVARLFAELSPDVVHTHGYRADVLHGGVARRARIPTVTTVHGFTGGGWKNRLYERLQRGAFRSCDAVVAVSRPLQERLRAAGLPWNRVHCVPNAWAADTEFDSRPAARDRLGIPDEVPLIGFVGRLGREKGADVFVDSCRSLPPAIQAILIGDGGLRPSLEARVRESGLDQRVRFLGMVSEAGRLMKALDVFVLSSRTEGTPIALLEAIAAGVPVVATRVGGVPDVLGEEGGLLVGVERADEIAAGIEEILAEPERAARRAEQASERLRTIYGAADWVARYDHVYARARSGRNGK